MAQLKTILGDFYEKGRGVQQSYSEAIKWYLKAVEKGVALAHLNLGLLYRDGKGVKQDYAEAARRFQVAADKGVEKAKEELAALLAAGCIKPA